MSEPRDEVLNRYASRGTTPEEERELLRRAMDDQNAFDALADEALLRELLDDPAAREILLRPAARRSAWQEFAARILRPKALLVAACAAVAAVAVVVGVSLSHTSGPSAVPAALSSSGNLSDFDRLPDDTRTRIESFLNSGRATNSGARISVETTAANRVRISAGYNSPGNLLVVALPPGGAGRILYPNAGSSPGPVKGGQSLTVPADDSRDLSNDLPDRTRLVLLAFAPGADPAAAIQRGEPLPIPDAIASVDLRRR